MKKIIYLFRGNLDKAIPAVTALSFFMEQKIRLVVITDECNQEFQRHLQEHQVPVELLHTFSLNHGSRTFHKIRSWLNFRKKAWNAINKYYEKDDMLWIGSADTTLALGKRLLQYKYALHIRELYDMFPRYRNGLKIYAQNAAGIIVPEMSRAACFRVWWQLKKTPFIVPNKPFFHPKTPNMPISDEKIRHEIEQTGDTPIILYQGHIEAGRSLDTLAQAVQRTSVPVQLVLMGRDHGNFVDRLRMYSPSLLYLGYVQPPHHLEVTSHAAIGVIQYNFSCLNHVFCAPNKIWEYSGFGFPALVADLPALRYYYDRYHAGVCCDFDSVEDITCHINQILDNRQSYQQGALALFHSFDITMEYQKILTHLCFV